MPFLAARAFAAPTRLQAHVCHSLDKWHTKTDTDTTFAICRLLHRASLTGQRGLSASQ